MFTHSTTSTFIQACQSVVSDHEDQMAREGWNPYLGYPDWRDVARLAAAYYARDDFARFTGGNLHVILDDGNVDEDLLNHTLEDVQSPQPPGWYEPTEHGPWPDLDAVAFLRLLLLLPEPLRELVSKSVGGTRGVPLTIPAWVGPMDVVPYPPDHPLARTAEWGAYKERYR